MKKNKALRLVETYLLPKGAKCIFDGKVIYDFLGMDGMYGRFKRVDNGEVGYTYGKFVYNEDKDLFEYFK